MESQKGKRRMSVDKAIDVLEIGFAWSGNRDKVKELSRPLPAG